MDEGNRPERDRPHDNDRIESDRPQSDRPESDRPGGDRPSAVRVASALRTVMAGWAVAEVDARVPALVGLLAGVVDPAQGGCVLPELTERTIHDVVIACERVAAWVAAVQVEALAELSARARAGDAAEAAGWEAAGGRRRWEHQAHSREDALVAEVALTCSWSQFTAGARIRAAGQVSRLPATAEALRRARLDLAKVVALADATEALSDQDAARVETAALARTARWTNTPGLRRFLNRAVAKLQADHDGADNPAPDGAAAGADADPHGDQAAGARAAGRESAAQRLTAALRGARRVVCAPTGDESGLSLPVGVVAVGTVWALVDVTDMAMIEKVVAGLAAGYRRGGDERDLDQRRASAFVHAFRHAADTLLNPTTQTMPVAAGRAQRADVTVTMTLETALGLAQDPAYLTEAGHLPIAAALARDVARNGTWRCAVVDAEHGTLLGLGQRGFRAGYTPSTRLDAYTTLRDSTCSFPGCHRRIATQADHRIKYRDGGPTCECNLQRLCTTHHRLKDTGYFSVTTSTDPTDPPGTLTWTTPHGYTIKRRPPRLDTRAA